MVGIRETVDLDITRALQQVKQLEAAVGRVGRVGVADTARDVDRIGKEADQATKSVDRLGSSFKGIRTAAAGALSALGTRFVVDQIGQAIDAASDLAESTSKVNVVFGESTGVIESWAETSATSVGLSKQAALEAAGTFGNLFTAMGTTRDAAAGLAPDVVQLAADLASFNNLGVPETLEKLRSGLVGEIEPLRSLGISFNAAAVEAKAMELNLLDSNGELSEGAKLQARWALITEQSTAASGDFARTSDGLANQQRILSAELGNARAEIGQRLLPAMLKAVEVGRSFLEFFQSLPEPVQNGALAVAALGIALGPILSVAGNFTRAISGISTAMTALATTSSALAITTAGFAAGLVAVAATLYAFDRITQGFNDIQDEMRSKMVESTNTLALQATRTNDSASAMRDAAVAAFVEGAALRGMSSDAEGAARSSEDLAKDVEAARRVLDSLAKQTGVSRDRIAQLATEMGINLANATEEQREKLSAALTQIAEGVSPTERLKEAAKTLGNEFATSAEEVTAFRDALDAALGAFLSAEEATIRVRQKTDELAEAFAKGAESGETHQQFQDRLALSTIDVTRAIEDEVQALTADGRISTDAAAQKEALQSRLLHLADVLGGPMATQLREHARQIEEIPDAAVTDVKADTSKATAAVAGLPGLFSSKGHESGVAFFSGTAAGLDDGVQRAIERARAAAGRVIQTVKDTFGEASPSKVGIQIGGFFAEGIAIGVDQQAALAVQAAEALALGVGEQVHAAAQLTLQEQATILGALDRVRSAQERLEEVRKDAKATALDLASAELDLAAAQEAVNQAVFEGSDATSVIVEEIERQRQAVLDLRGEVSASLSAISAVGGVDVARERLAEAERERARLLRLSIALPHQVRRAEETLTRARAEAAEVTDREALAIVQARQRIEDAEARLAEVEADATATKLDRTEAELQLIVAQEELVIAQEEAVGMTREVEEAERELKKLREEEARVAEQLAEANRRVEEATAGVVQAQQRLVEAGDALATNLPGVIDIIRQLGEAAGLTSSQIDRLVDSVEESHGAIDDSQVPGISSRSQRLINPATGRPVFTGPRGEGGAADPGTIARHFGVPASQVRSFRMPDGTTAYYLPGQAIDPGNVAALAAARPITRPTSTKAAPQKSGSTYNVTINPKQAVYDAKSTLSTLRQLELLR